MVIGVEGEGTVFPKGLEGSEAPAGSLAEEVFEGFWCFGEGDGVGFVSDEPMIFVEGEGEVSVFSEGIVLETACLEDSGFSEGGECTWGDGDGVDGIECWALEDEGGGVFEVLEEGEEIFLVTYEEAAGASCDLVVGEAGKEGSESGGGELGICVNCDDEFV